MSAVIHSIHPDRIRAQAELMRRSADVEQQADIPPPVPLWIALPLMALFSLVLTFAVWKFATWFLPIVWGWK